MTFEDAMKEARVLADWGRQNLDVYIARWNALQDRLGDLTADEHEEMIKAAGASGTMAAEIIMVMIEG